MTKRIDIDENYFVTVKPDKHSMDFEIIEQHSDGDTSVRIAGYLKWDGTMKWFVNGPSPVHHFCAVEDAELLCSIFKRIYEEGPISIERWSEG